MQEPRDPCRTGLAVTGIGRLAIALAPVLAAAAPAQEIADAPRGPWFGQEAPGLVPAVFAPGIVSLADRYEYVIAFSPDGTECCFGVTNSDWSTCDLFHSRQERGVWSKPEPAVFQQGVDGWLPFFTPDGERLLFSSGRPDQRTANSYVCERAAGGWGAPMQLGAPIDSPSFDWRPTETASGTLYFASDRPGGEGLSDIYRTAAAADGSLVVESLGLPVNSPSLEASPCLSPDARVLTLESWRPGGFGKGDLYVCYRRSDGSWTEPRNLGPRINTAQIEDGGSFTPDGKHFFFNRRADWITEEQTDLYWVDVRAIHAPHVSRPIGAVGATVGVDFALLLPADEFADHDDDTLAVSARAAGGGPLPAWLTFDPETRTLSGTPDRVGVVEIEITATDSVGSVTTDVLTIRVGG